MTDHVSTSQMELFARSVLPGGETDSISEHLMTCEACHQLFVEALRRQKDSTGLNFTILPESLLRHEHIEYEQLVGLADNKLDATDREIIDTHLSTCASCREDVRSFLAFKSQLGPELRVRYGPSAIEPQRKKVFWVDWWRGLAWNPAYAAAVVLIGIALVIGVVLLLKRRAGSLEAKRTQPSQGVIGPAAQTPTPENQALTVQPTPAPAPSEQLPRPAPNPPLTVKNREPLKPVENARAVAMLNDELGTVTVDKGGNVTGLDEIPENNRREVVEALIAHKIETPEITRELSSPKITLRGVGTGQPFKLFSPARTVIISDRPSFLWERLPGATSYHILVGDSKGREAVKSETLPPTITTWTPQVALKRGEIYSWAVVAVIDGKEITSPGAFAPEMKFQILATDDLKQLNLMKDTHSRLAIGIFYAKVGLIAEAEAEFRHLVRINPKSKLVRHLLRSLRSP